MCMPCAVNDVAVHRFRIAHVPTATRSTTAGLVSVAAVCYTCPPTWLAAPSCSQFVAWAAPHLSLLLYGHFMLYGH
eukprot:scaffold10220_cov144-Isochrysis_galbana.AAC.2